jgi:hypothetical protein
LTDEKVITQERCSGIILSMNAYHYHQAQLRKLSLDLHVQTFNETVDHTAVTKLLHHSGNMQSEEYRFRSLCVI